MKPAEHTACFGHTGRTLLLNTTWCFFFYGPIACSSMKYVVCSLMSVYVVMLRGVYFVYVQLLKRVNTCRSQIPCMCAYLANKADSDSDSQRTSAWSCITNTNTFDSVHVGPFCKEKQTHPSIIDVDDGCPKKSPTFLQMASFTPYSAQVLTD